MWDRFLCSMWDLVPWPGIEPGPPQHLSHWTISLERDPGPLWKYKSGGEQLTSFEREKRDVMVLVTQGGLKLQNGGLLRRCRPERLQVPQAIVWASVLSGKLALQAFRIQASVWCRGQWVWLKQLLGIIALWLQRKYRHTFSSCYEHRRVSTEKVVVLSKEWKARDFGAVEAKLLLDRGCWATGSVTQDSTCWSHCFWNSRAVDLQSLFYVDYTWRGKVL